ncbi:MAG TPA: T9SS type A sorting domain-containing protein [Saprospiraceae bacterium]|nr:T9SS type A sorting domain-containing protein [Saprospiraceae bacterium]
MKSIFTLLSFVFCLSLSAQITYTEASGPKVGTKIEKKYLTDLTGFDWNQVTAPGSNRTWDLRGDDEDDATYQYVSVDNLPFKNRFPGTNLAKITLPLGQDSAYTMMEKSSSGLYQIGEYDTSIVLLFNPKLINVPYPLTFGQNYQNDATAEFVQDGIPFKADLKSNSNVDAWGMVTTNTGTFPVLKIKSIQIIEVTTSGIPIASSTIETHSWAANGYAEPVADLVFSESETPFGLFNDTSIYFIHRQELVGSQDVAGPALKLSLSPNPVQDELHIACPEAAFSKGNFSIISAEGKTILAGELAPNEIKRVDVSKLVTGNYLVQVVLDQKTVLFDILTKK